MSDSARRVSDRPDPTLRVAVSSPDPRRLQFTANGAVQAGPVDIKGSLTDTLLTNGNDINYMGETAGGDLAATLHIGPVSTRLRVHRNPFTGANFYATDVNAAVLSPGLAEGHSGVGLEGTAGVGLMRPYGGLAARNDESRLLPFARLRGIAELERGEWTLRSTLSADMIASLGVPGGTLNAVDSTMLTGSVALEWQRGGKGAGMSLSGTVGYANSELYLTSSSVRGSGALELYGHTTLGPSLTLSGRVTNELLTLPDAGVRASTRGVAFVTHDKIDVNVFGGVDSYLAVSAGAGVGVQVGPVRLGLDAGAANYGLVGFAPQGMLTLGMGRDAQPARASAQTLDQRTRRIDSARDSSYRQLLAQVASGDVGAIATLQDLQGILGWANQTKNGTHVEQTASETERRGTGDCSDQAVLWTYLFNQHGRKHWDTWIFNYHHDGAESGHAFSVLRHKETGKVFVSEYGATTMLQNVPPSASDAQIAELVRQQMPDTRAALGGYELRRGATGVDESFDALPRGVRGGRVAPVTDGVVAVPLRGAGMVLGRDRVFGDR